MLKIDLKKAYDPIHWTFIQKLLSSLKFPLQFITCVMACITTTSFSIQLNVSLEGYFKGGRGLRKGDPLSPILFILSMEYLSRLFHVQSQTQGFGFHPNCRKLKIVQLMFADDLVLFCKADKSSVEGLIQAFHKFSHSSGLDANKAKSQVMLGGCGENTRKIILDITGFGEGGLPFRYLGYLSLQGSLANWNVECKGRK